MDQSEQTEIIAKLEIIIENLSQIIKDHEGRIRFLERIVGYGLGALGLIEFGINTFYKH